MVNILNQYAHVCSNRFSNKEVLCGISYVQHLTNLIHDPRDRLFYQSQFEIENNGGFFNL